MGGNAKTVLSAEESLRPDESIDQWIEYALLPTDDQLAALRDECLNYPLVVCMDDSRLASLKMREKIRGAGRRSRLAVVAEIAAEMKCFKGAIMLWCELLDLTRARWNRKEDFHMKGLAS